MLSAEVIEALPLRGRMQASTSYTPAQLLPKAFKPPAQHMHQGISAGKNAQRQARNGIGRVMARAGKSNTLKEAPVLKTLSPRQDHKQVRALVFTHHKIYRKAAAPAQ